MDAATFLNPEEQPKRPSIGEWLFAFAKLALGIAILFGAARLVPEEYP